MKSNAKKTTSSSPQLKPRYGVAVRIANTTLIPPRMGVPGRINVGTQVLEPIVEHFLRVDKAGNLLPHLIESWENKSGRIADYVKCAEKY